MQSRSINVTLFFVLGSILLAGCATTKEQWAHPKYAGQPNAKDMAIIAKAECDSYASGRTPYPKNAPAYMPVPDPSSYTTTGTYQSNGATGGTYTARTTANNSFATGFANGWNQGAAIAAAMAQSEAEARMHEISAACMRAQGWIDINTEEGKASLQNAITGGTSNEQTTATWSMASYPKATRSAKWRSLSGDGQKVSIGVFDPSESFGVSDKNIIGLIIRSDFDAPTTNGSLQIDTLITVYMFNCADRTYADLGQAAGFHGKAVFGSFKETRPQFSAPNDQTIQSALDTYCSAPR